MATSRSPTEKSPLLAPTWRPLEKMNVEELRAELSSAGLTISVNKAVLMERLTKYRLQQQASQSPQQLQSPDPTEGKPSEMMLLFTLMKQQQEADREAAERRFQLQREADREAAERRFQLQLEEIRQNAAAERLNMANFLGDVMKKVSERHSSSSGDSTKAEIINKKFQRMNAELVNSLLALELKHTTSRSIEEIDVLIKTVELGLNDLKVFIDSKIDHLDNGEIKKGILDGFMETKRVYLIHIPLAKVKAAKLRAVEEADRAAESLPSGVNPPVFYGNILNFPTFWEFFEPLVHKNPKVSRFYKITHLKAAMKGSAAGILNGFPSTANNYEPAVETVMKRFGRDQATVRSHIKDLLGGQQREHSVEKVRKLLDLATAKKSVLSQHNISWNQIFTQILEAQLPAPLYERWIRKISPMIESNDVADSKLLFEFINTELATMESLQKNSRRFEKPDSKQSKPKQLNNQGNQSNRASTTFSAQSLVAQVATSCSYALCGKEHALKECKEFLKLNPTQRMASLISNPGKVCFRCLAPKGQDGHPKNFYQCKERCTISDCGKPHHDLLHVPEASSSKVLVSTIRRSERPIFNDSDVDTVLPTAMSRITNGVVTREVRVAFDSFSRKSFSTRELAEDLKLKPSIKREALTISGLFGGNCASGHMDIVKFALQPVNSSYQNEFEIEAHVQNGIICAPLEEVSLSPDQIYHIEGLDLADPFSRIDGTVDILLGGRYYFFLMKGFMINPVLPETGPIAIETMFGWVL